MNVPLMALQNNPPQNILLPTQFVIYADLLTGYYLAAKGTQASGYGLGDRGLTVDNDWGASRFSRRLLLAVSQTHDNTQIGILQGPFNTLLTISWQDMLPTKMRNALQGLGQDCQRAGIAGVSNIDTYMTYFNTGLGGPYNAIAPPDFIQVHKFWKGVAPSVWNVYSPSIASMARKVTGGAFSPGTSVDTANYAGTGAAYMVISSFGGTGGAASVTGSARDSGGTVRTGRIFRCTITGNGTFLLTPDNRGDLLVSVNTNGINLPGGLSGGVLAVITGNPPIGRNNPPI